MRLAGHIACMGERRGAHMVLVGKHEGNNYCQEGTGVEGRIILK
jgi:hypothetical protein